MPTSNHLLGRNDTKAVAIRQATSRTAHPHAGKQQHTNSKLRHALQSFNQLQRQMSRANYAALYSQAKSLLCCTLADGTRDAWVAYTVASAFAGVRRHGTYTDSESLEARAGPWCAANQWQSMASQDGAIARALRNQVALSLDRLLVEGVAVARACHSTTLMQLLSLADQTAELYARLACSAAVHHAVGAGVPGGALQLHLPPPAVRGPVHRGPRRQRHAAAQQRHGLAARVQPPPGEFLACVLRYVPLTAHLGLCQRLNQQGMHLLESLRVL
jgi:hypothetical protein